MSNILKIIFLTLLLSLTIGCNTSNGIKTNVTPTARSDLNKTSTSLKTGSGVNRTEVTQDPKSNISQTNEIQKIEDIQYADNCDACILDIYKKDNNIKNKTIIFFVHGGGWKLWDKSFQSQKWEFFAKNGYLFIAVEYPLFPEALYNEQAKRVAQALKWVINNAIEHNGDKNNIIIMWHSAWGHLVSLISTDESYLASVDLDLKSIKETILLDSAGLDIPEVRKVSPFIFNTIYKPIFWNKLKDLKVASPINHIAENKDIPNFIIFYSTLNKSTMQNAINFDKKLSNFNIKSEIYGIDATHEDLNKNIGSKDDEVTKKIIEHLKK